MRKLPLLLLLPLFFITHLLSASDSIKSPLFYSINYRYGQNKPHRPIVENLVYPYRSIDVKMGWQTQGNKAWHTAYRNPSFGIGFNYATFNTKTLGNPASIYFFTHFPQYNAAWGRMDLNVDFGFSYGIHPYDKETNPGNFATGSKTNAFFGLYLEQSFNIGSHYDVFLAGGLTHYSNGALNWPNLGLNIPSVKVGMRYQPRASKVFRTKSEFERKFTFSTYIGSGSMFTFSSDTITYRSVLIQPSLNYRVGYKHRVGIGYEFAYNEGYRIHWSIERHNASGKELLFHSVFASHEFLIERFTILTQLAIYLGNHPVDDKNYYERIGFAYYITPWMRAALNLKAHYVKAEYVELGLMFDIGF